MQLLQNTEKFIAKDKDSENVVKPESVEIFLVHCNLVNNNYQQESTEFSSIEVWFTDQNSMQPEIEDTNN